MTLDGISEILWDLCGRFATLEGRVRGNTTATDLVQGDEGRSEARRPPLLPTPLPGVARADYASIARNQPRGPIRTRQPRGPSSHTHDHHLYQRDSKPTYNAQPRILTTNLDFWFVVNTIFNLVRLEHHRFMWVSLPNGVGRLLGDLIGMISPPLPDDAWRAEMENLEKEFGKNIIRITRGHIESRQTDLIRALRSCNPEDKEDAGMLAYNRLLTRYGEKIRTKRMRDYFQLVLSYIGTNGTNPTRPPTSGPSQPTPTTPASSSGQDLPTGAASVSTPQAPAPTQRKRAFSISPVPEYSEGRTEPFVLPPHRGTAKKTKMTSSSSTPDLHNMFAVLDDIQGPVDDGMEDTEVVPKKKQTGPEVASVGGRRDIRSFLSCSQPRRDSICSNAEGERSTEQRSTEEENTITRSESGSDVSEVKAKVHSKGTKSNWALKSRPSTRILVIGDSNLALGKTRGTDYEIQAYPGAYFSHMTQILSSAVLGDAVTDIVVAAGINHRGWDFKISTLPDLRKLHSVASTMKQRVHFLGVSSQLSNVSERDNIRYINKEAQERFGSEMFIPPLPPGQVCVGSDGIHHDVGTVSKILESIMKHVGQSGCLNGL